MIISVSKPILSRNQFDGRHWYRKHKETQSWEAEIFAALLGKIKKARGPMRVKITSYRKRLLDMDNLWGGGKLLVDAMKRLGLILNDTPKLLNLEYTQKVQKAGQGTIIEIEETN
jgi:Holliday junction resolvase RusA-like endonuclease